MKRIALPTDFSDNSWNAIFCALKMFESQPCHFVMINAYEVGSLHMARPVSTRVAGTLHDSAKKLSHEGLKKMLTYFDDTYRNEGHSFEVVSKNNSVVDALEEVVVEKGIDLIIMGTNGATGAKGVFMGSNAVKVLKNIRSCPVLVVPSGFEFKQLKRLVFPTDFTHFYNRTELLPMLYLAERNHTTLHIFHVAQTIGLSEEQEYNRATLKKHFKGHAYEFHKVDIQNTVSNAIKDFSKAIHADMMVLVHYKHTFLEKITQEPVVKKVAFSAEVPLLVLPELE